MMAEIPFDLDLLYENQVITALDYYFAKHVGRVFKETRPIVLSTLAWVSMTLQQGHICLDLHQTSGQIVPEGQSENFTVQLPDTAHWQKTLRSSSVVSLNTDAPLVMDSHDRVYMARYYDLQTRLVQQIITRARRSFNDIGPDTVAAVTGRLFKSDNPFALHQAEGVKKAVLNGFTIITGGPGTGKTYITDAIRHVLLSAAKEKGLPEPAIICAAPTGKAASKMDQGRTIHSLLKPNRSGSKFYYSKTNPLSVDAVIIDEASMIDLGLLTRFLEAIPMAARVVLLGDRHQLASVQAGSIFSDICHSLFIRSNIHILTHNFRAFGMEGISRLSAAINEKNPERIESLLKGNDYDDLVYISPEGQDHVQSVLKEWIIKEYSLLQDSKDITDAFAAADRFKILCAHNLGEYGTLQINHLCENVLRAYVNSGIQRQQVYKSVIIVNSNDYQRQLFNGDTGIIIENNRSENLFFRMQNDDIRQFRVRDLREYSPGFALTVHKAQGSEYDTVLLVLPQKISPVLTRQLLYTAVTRAKKRVVIIGAMQIIQQAVKVDTSRHSGIETMLEQAGNETEESD